MDLLNSTTSSIIVNHKAMTVSRNYFFYKTSLGESIEILNLQEFNLKFWILVHETRCSRVGSLGSLQYSYLDISSSVSTS